MTDPMEQLSALGLVVRRPTLDDAEGLFRLQAEVDTHEYGALDMSLEDIRAELAEVDLETDGWIVVPAAHGEDPIAYAVLPHRTGSRFRGQVAVHPRRRRAGIGTALAGLLESRARQRICEVEDPSAEAWLEGWVNADSEAAVAWSRSLGYEWARRFLRMRIDMTEPPPPPKWPDGITVRTFRVGEDERAFYEAQEEAFADHWGHVTMPLEEWVKRTERHDFEPALWLVALDGDRMVATSTNSVIPDNLGWIAGLGVVPSHRRRGLARAILLTGFNIFWKRGQHSVALGVDADSPNGATRLYESTGMRTVERHDQVRKVLRPPT